MSELSRDPEVFLPQLTLPSPVYRTRLQSPDGAELYIKNDGELSPLYAGNKARKLMRLLPIAQAQGKRVLLTVGPAGSHHVLATTLHGTRFGFRVRAVLAPQPWSEHAEHNLRRALAAGLEAYPVRSFLAAPLRLAQLHSSQTCFIPAGGSNVEGSFAYLEAVNELLDQIRAGELPEPDVIVVALGSGGTAAGLLAGVVRNGLRSRICAVQTVGQPVFGRGLVLGLASGALRRDRFPASPSKLQRQLTVEGRYRGAGYAVPTSEGRLAMRVAEKLGRTLETTYTAKAFACALEIGRFAGYDALAWPRQPATNRNAFWGSRKPTRVLYWHTLSESERVERGDYPTSLPSELRALFAPLPNPTARSAAPTHARPE